VTAFTGPRRHREERHSSKGDDAIWYGIAAAPSDCFVAVKTMELLAATWGASP
jgi:hypothetical protein